MECAPNRGTNIHSRLTSPSRGTLSQIYFSQEDTGRVFVPLKTDKMIPQHNYIAFVGRLLNATAASFTQELQTIAANHVPNVEEFFRDWRIEVFQIADGQRMVLYIDPFSNIFQSA